MAYINKLAPLATVLAIAIYCMLTGMAGSGSKSDAKQSAKLPVFTPELFSPIFPPYSKRNPFYLPGDEPKVAVQSVPTEKKVAEAKPAAAEAAKEFFASLALNATYLTGEQRLAIINGQIYKQKDKLKQQNPSIPPFIVAQILPYEVLLECEGKTLHLRYSNVYAGTGAPKSAIPTASKPKVDSKRESKSKLTAPVSRPATKANP
jgi:hypothetical protein